MILNSEAHLEPVEEQVVCHCQQCGADICVNDEIYGYDCEIFCTKSCAIDYMLSEGDLVKGKCDGDEQ